jgi:hypothetical protein
MNQYLRVTGLLGSVLLGLQVFQASAADLRVRVFERSDHTPLAGVAVCVGTQAKTEQFGAVFTDASGYALFDSLPRAQLLVTASMTGYKSEQEQMVTSNTDRMLVLTLSAGGGGPVCMTEKTAAPGDAGGPVIASFAINRGAATSARRSVTLNNAVRGKVTQYRASERADFADTQWQDYSSAPAFTLSEGAGSKTVFFQVRRHSALGDAVVETLSPVAQDSVTVQGN